MPHTQPITIVVMFYLLFLTFKIYIHTQNDVVFGMMQTLEIL